MAFINQLRRARLRQASQSTGDTRGIYIRAEKSSKVQFAPIFLTDAKLIADALGPLGEALDVLY